MKRALIIVAILGLAAWAATQLFRAEALRPRVSASLESALRRKVDVNGQIDYKWLTGPGLEINDVVIHEDSRLGREPIAYVVALEATPRWLSLLRGRIEFSTLRLIDPSLNVSRSGNGALNIQPFLEGLRAARESDADLPEIRVRGGRVNFIQDSRKSIFYLSNVDLDLQPTESNGFNVSLAAENSRTDRVPMGYGSFSGRGRLQLRPNAEPTLELTLDLDRTPISDLALLTQNRRASIGGRISARAKVNGPVSKIAIDGRIDLEGFQRWNTPGWKPGAITLYFQGAANLARQTVELDTVRDKNSNVGLRARVRAGGILSKPHWGAIAVAQELPLAFIVDAARLMGFRLPDGFAPLGTATGAVGISSSTDWQGGLMLTAPGIEGRYDILPADERPHRIAIVAGDADITGWAKNLKAPDWSGGIRSQGTFEARSLAVTDQVRFRGIRARWTWDDDRLEGVFAARTMGARPEFRAVRSGFDLRFTPRGIEGSLTGIQAATDTAVHRGTGEITLDNRFTLDLGGTKVSGRAWPPEAEAEAATATIKRN